MGDRYSMPNTINLVLFGKSGNGKSATGNSILGANAFLSMPSLFGVTSSCESKSTKWKDGRVLNVIDTPELFDRSDEEIVRFVNFAKDGIQAILLVFSVKSRYSPDVEAATERLKTFFGEKILNYTIIVFTGADELKRFGLSLYDFICHKSNCSLQKFLQYCNGRIILFDNETSVEEKRVEQLDGLMYLVETVIANNCAKPFSLNISDKLKGKALMRPESVKEVESIKGYSEQQISALKEEICKSNDDLFPRITEMVEQRLMQMEEYLEKRCAEERAARLEAAKLSEEARIKDLQDRTKLEDTLLAKMSLYQKDSSASGE